MAAHMAEQHMVQIPKDILAKARAEASSDYIPGVQCNPLGTLCLYTFAICQTFMQHLFQREEIKPFKESGETQNHCCTTAPTLWCLKNHPTNAVFLLLSPSSFYLFHEIKISSLHKLCSIIHSPVSV